MSMEVHTCNPSTSKTEARGLWVRSQPELHSENLSKNKKQKKEKEWSTNKDYHID
jgi:hypothetical protein